MLFSPFSLVFWLALSLIWNPALPSWFPFNASQAAAKASEGSCTLDDNEQGGFKIAFYFWSSKDWDTKQYQPRIMVITSKPFDILIPAGFGYVAVTERCAFDTENHSCCIPHSDRCKMPWLFRWKQVSYSINCHEFPVFFLFSSCQRWQNYGKIQQNLMVFTWFNARCGSTKTHPRCGRKCCQGSSTCGCRGHWSCRCGSQQKAKTMPQKICTIRRNCIPLTISTTKRLNSCLLQFLIWWWIQGKR